MRFHFLPRWSSSWVSLVLLPLAALSQSCGSPVVGAECRAGLFACNGMCIDVDSDFRNCGRCGNDCGAFVCERGMCTERVRPPLIDDGGIVRLPDGSIIEVDDGGVPVDPDMDASTGDAKVPGDYDASIDRDAQVGGCGVGRTDCGGACVSLGSDLAHCGACDLACDDGEVCSAGMCAPECAEGLTRCGATCFDLMSDADNCGSCGSVCMSGICREGECADAVPGQLVVVGHNYRGSNRFQDTLLGNSLFLARGAPVRTLVFEGSASSTSRAGVERAINFVSDSIGREWEQIEGVESLITLQLADADAFLIHAQGGSTDSVLEKQSELWAMAMRQFVAQGGVIVLIEDASSENQGTFQVLHDSELFRAGGREPLMGIDLQIATPGVGIALRVGDMYRGETSTVRFVDVSTVGVAITTDDAGSPVIYQRIVR